MHTLTHVCTLTLTHMCTHTHHTHQTHTCTYTNIHVHTHMHTNTYMYTHTQHNHNPPFVVSWSLTSRRHHNPPPTNTHIYIHTTHGSAPYQQKVPKGGQHGVDGKQLPQGLHHLPHAATQTLDSVREHTHHVQLGERLPKPHTDKSAHVSWTMSRFRAHRSVSYGAREQFLLKPHRQERTGHFDYGVHEQFLFKPHRQDHTGRDYS